MFCFACPNCHSALRTNDTSHGAIVSCPSCTQRLRVPPAQPAAAQPAQPAAIPASRPRRSRRPEDSSPAPSSSPGKKKKRQPQRSPGFFGDLAGSISRQLMWLALFLGFNVLACCGFYGRAFLGGWRGSADRVAVQPVQAEKLSAAQLVRAYQANEEAAHEKYDGKTLEITGVVDQVGKDQAGTAYLLLQGGGGADPLRVQCFFFEDEDEDGQDTAALLKLPQGQEVTIRGQCSGKRGNVCLTDCVRIQ